MEKFNFRLVLKQLPYSLLYLVIGSSFAVFVGYFLFNLDKKMFEFILTIWFKRVLFGAYLLGENSYTFWFILNNIVALFLVIVASIVIITHISKTPEFILTKKFKTLRKYRPKIILTGLYMVPVGASLLNGFIISLLLTYVLLNFGFGGFTEIVLLLLPHGINELIALLFASSLGLAYLKILSPLILKEKWELCRKIGRNLLKSRVTLFVVLIVVLLIVFSGFLEGSFLELI
jgi:uncharacterized membrane protein SpoIIM required for sporulation